MEIELLAVNEREMAELERVVAVFVQRERRLPGYDDLLRHKHASYYVEGVVRDPLE